MRNSLAPMILALAAALWLAPPGTATADEPAELIARGDYAEAMQLLRERTGDADGDGHDWHLLGDARHATGDGDGALEAYREAHSRDSAHAPTIGVSIARILQLRGQAEEAGRMLRDIIERYRANPGAADYDATMAAAEAASLLSTRDSGLSGTALDIYERAITLAPDDPAPRVGLADLLLAKYNNAEALPLYREALELDENHVDALVGMARSQYFDYASTAADTVRKAVSINPRHVEARVLLARLLLDEGDYDGAAEQLDAAFEVNPSDPSAASLALALKLLTGDEDGFNAGLEALRARAPGYLEVYTTLAEIAAEHRLYARAVQFSRSAVYEDSSFWKAFALLGINQLRLGWIDQGRANLETAFRGDPYNVWVKNTLELADRVQDFVTIRRGRFILSATRRDASVLAPMLFPLAEQAYDRLAERYGHRPRTPIRIEFYDRRDDFSVRTVGLVGVDIVGVSFGPTVALVSPEDFPGSINWASVLWHELAHTFHMSMSDSRVPRWFTEGLSVVEERLADPGWGSDVDASFLGSYARGKLPPASRLNEAFIRPAYPNQVLHAYVMGSLLIEFIEQRHGMPALLKMLEGFGAGKITDSVITDSLRMSPAELDLAFDRYMRTRYAHAFDALDLEPGIETAHAAMSPEGGGTCRELWKAGNELFEAGDHAAAEQVLLEAKKLIPEFAGPGSPYHTLAEIYAERGETGKAIEMFHAIVAIDGDQAEPLKKLGQLYLDQQDQAAAAESLEQALHVVPFDAEVRSRLAAIHESAGDFPLAVVQREAIVNLDPVDPAAAHFQLARALDAAQNPGRAREAVLRSLEIAPMYDEALELLLAVRSALGHDDIPGGDPVAEENQRTFEEANPDE